jgi:hypothetical protein
MLSGLGRLCQPARTWPWWRTWVPVKVISERLGHATVAITLDVYSHVIPGMDELAATTVAGLILGDAPANRTPNRPIDKPVTSKPSSIERRKEVEARRSRSAVVSEGGLEPTVALPQRPRSWA